MYIECTYAHTTVEREICESTERMLTFNEVELLAAAAAIAYSAAYVHRGSICTSKHKLPDGCTMLAIYSTLINRAVVVTFKL